MAQSIALNIKVKIDGNEQVITNLEQTENAIRQLKAELATTEFGSQRFQEISVDLQKLRAQVENVDKATEGLGMEKRLRAINDATNLLTGSFSLLTGAMTLAAASQEDLVKIQQAEAKAMAAVNIVLGARAISEGLLESKVLRREAAEKLSITTSRIFIGTAKLVSAGLKSIGISAGVASQGVRVLTAALFALGIPAIIYGLTLLYDALTETNKELESKAPLTAKEYYDELKTSIDKLNETQTIRLNYAKAFGASEKEILEQDLKDKQVIYEKTEQAQKDLFDKLAFLNGELLRNTGAFSSRTRARLNADIANIKENIAKTTNDLSKFSTDRKNAETAITDFEKKEQEKRQAQAKEAADKRKQLEIKNIQERLAVQLEYLETLQQLGDSQIEVDVEVIQRVKTIIEDQNALLEQRTEAAKTAKQQLEEDLEIDLFKVIPSESDRKLFRDSFLAVFEGVNNAITEGNSGVLNGTNKTFDDLVKIALEKNPSNQILLDYQKISTRIKDINQSLKDDAEGKFILPIEQVEGFRRELIRLKEEQSQLITPQGQKDLTAYFNLLSRFTKELSGDKLATIFKIPPIETKVAQTTLLEFVNGAEDILKDFNAGAVLEGDVVPLITERITEKLTELGIVRKSLRDSGGNLITDEKQVALIDAQNKKVESLTKSLVELSLGSAKTNISVDDVGEQLKDLTIISSDLEKQLERQGVVAGTTAKLTQQEIENSIEKVKQTAASSPQAFTDFVKDFISNSGKVVEVVDETGKVVIEGVDGIREKFLKVLSPQDLITFIQKGSEGLTDITFESVKEIESLINILKQLELDLGEDAFLSPAGEGVGTFTEVINELIKKMKELQEETKETGETFAETFSESKFKKISDVVFNIFSETSSRLSELYSTSNSLLLEKLQYAQDTTLSLIGEANTESVAQNKIIAAERLKIEKDYQKKRFEVEKRARIQELQFGLANAVSNSAQAIINQYATLPLAAAIPLSLVVAGLTAAQVAVINDQIQFTQSKTFIGRRGGLIQGDTHEDGGVPALLEGGEFVMSRAAVEQYGDTLGMMNSSVGGRPLAIDDSRIVQAISKQNTSTKVPLKTYVLYNDIQNTEKLNNKIEQLSRL